MRNHYLSKIAPLQKESASPFYSLTGHSWYAPYGAQWGADMIGLETGENIIAMQAKSPFYAGQHDRTICRSISSLRSSLAVQFRFSKRGEDEYTPHQLDKAKVLEAISQGRSAIPNGGYSPSLLSRMWYMAWLSGAAIVCPENCQVNFFNS